MDLDDIDNLEEELVEGVTPENRNDRQLISALRRMIEALPEREEEPEDEPEQIPPGKLAAKLAAHLRALKGNSKLTELAHQTVCQKCGDPPSDAMVTSCLHVYCKECLESIAHAASVRDQDHTACLVCGTIFASAESCDGVKELDFDPMCLLSDSAGKKKRNTKVNMEWVAYDKKLVLSAKTIAVRNKVEEWLEEEPQKKIIIFSQFHMVSVMFLS